jgi:Transposase DDE domain
MTIAETVQLLKDRAPSSVPATLIQRLCRAVGHRWRERDLGPVVTTHLFLQQILHGNAAAGELRRLSGVPFTDAGYCQARQRLPRRLLERLQQAVTGRLWAGTARDPAARWHGHRVFLLDGSSFSMPDTPALQAYFGQPAEQAEGCGFPVAHLMVLCDAAAGYLLRTEALPLRSGDMAHAAALHAALKPGDVLVGDRAFASFAHLALCTQRGLRGLFRAHQKQIISFRPHRRHRPPKDRGPYPKGMPSSRWLQRLGYHDQLVEYVKPTKRPEWMTAEDYARLPETVMVREVRVRVGRAGQRTRVITLVTTLLDAEKYPAKELARLYGVRWGVEIFHADYRSSASLYLEGVAA